MRPQTRARQDGALSRRAALGLGLAGGAVGVAGCALNNPYSTVHTPAGRAVRDLEPDVAVAVQAVTAIRTAQAAVTSTRDQHPPLAGHIAGLLAAHRAHLDALQDAVPKGVDTTPTTDAPYAVPAAAKPALRQLVHAERTLHDELVGLALKARSGPFARLLGEMAAALSQQLEVLAR